MRIRQQRRDAVEAPEGQEGLFEDELPSSDRLERRRGGQRPWYEGPHPLARDACDLVPARPASLHALSPAIQGYCARR